MDGVRPEIEELWNKSLQSDSSNKQEEVVSATEFLEVSPPASGGEMAKVLGGKFAEPEPDDNFGDSFLGKTLDILSRGEYASANLIVDNMMGKPFDIKAYKRGITGEEKHDFQEIVNTIKPDWSPWKRKTLGLALSIFGDLTTYIPSGTLTVPAKIAARSKPGMAARKAVRESFIGEAFIPGAKVSEEFYESKYYAKKKLEAQEQKIIRQLEKMRSGINREDMELLSHYREHPEKIHELSPKLKEKLDYIGTVLDKQIDEAEKSGLITKEVATKWRGRDIPYFPHYYPERGISLSSPEVVPSLFEKVKKPSFLKNRKYDTIDDVDLLKGQFDNIAKAKTVEEANGLMKSYGLENAFGITKKLKLKDIRDFAEQQSKLYTVEKNAPKAVAYRQIEQARVIAKKEFIDQTLERFGTKVLSGTRIVPEGYGIYLPKNAIRFYSKEVLEPSFIDELKHLSDKLKDLRLQTEKTVTTKTTSTTSAVKGAETGPMSKLEKVVKDALVSRGMTEGEASVYLSKIKANGSGAVDDIEKVLVEKVEQINTVLNSQGLEGELLDVRKLTENQVKTIAAVTTKVPTYAVPEAIRKDLDSATKFFIGDPASRKMLRFFDKGQNLWKGMATSLRVPFHLRNMYSNWFQANLAGVKNPVRFEQAADVQLSYLTKSNKTIELGSKKYTYKELRTMANELGIRGKGWMGADINADLLGEIESVVKYGKLRKLTPFKLGRSFGTMIEDNSRFAVFLDRLAKGDTPKEACSVVRKYLFDYEELTEFEKKVMKRIWPFYTWTRKNAPLQIQQLLEQPRKYQIYGKSINAFREEETREEIIAKPEHFNKLMYVKSQFKTEQGKPIYMSLDLPPLEFNKLTDKYTFLHSATPYKLISEVVYNYKTFPSPGKLAHPLELTRAPWWVSYLPKQLRAQMGKRGLLDKRLNKETGEYELGINKKLLYGIHSALPMLNELSNIYTEPIALDDENPKLKRQSYLTGIGQRQLNVRKGTESEMKRIRSKKSDISRFINQRGRVPSAEELRKIKEQE